MAASNGHTEVVRCLCLAGCRIDVKNDQGISAEIAALAQGHKDTSDLLKRLKRVRMYTTIRRHTEYYPNIANANSINKFILFIQDSCCDDYIEQLIPSTSPIPKIKMKVFGHSGVGKTTLIESLRAGYFSGLFRRSKRSGSSSSTSSSSASALKQSNSSSSNPGGGAGRGSKGGE